ncbi:hypothetical protein [Micromonospora costi]|uniref:Uncharacterized protein n=1 Tax=Micromonospora costi TaxID=1530042 RepID=A0A3B0A394_9ACTN|nr:hypothetical protein [Micromonospora costi]RKN54116.1 hypothetical protein D7193_18995 [Micromonospora costi]
MFTTLRFVGAGGRGGVGREVQAVDVQQPAGVADQAMVVGLDDRSRLGCEVDGGRGAVHGATAGAPRGRGAGRHVA